MVRKAVPQTWCNIAEGSIPHGVELSTGGPEEPAASISEGVGGDLWYDHFL